MHVSTFDGDRLKAARRHAGMTRYEASTIAGVRETTIYRWESGRDTPRLDILAPLAAALGLTLDELIAGAPA